MHKNIDVWFDAVNAWTRKKVFHQFYRQSMKLYKPDIRGFFFLRKLATVKGLTCRTRCKNSTNQHDVAVACITRLRPKAQANSQPQCTAWGNFYAGYENITICQSLEKSIHHFTNANGRRSNWHLNGKIDNQCQCCFARFDRKFWLFIDQSTRTRNYLNSKWE